jgi:phosphohistidine phosphatase
MMELYLLRHAIAVDRGTHGFADDSKRPLTEEGARKMRKIAKGIRALDLSLDAILSSPFTRARQTAEIVADILEVKDKLDFTSALSTSGDHRALVEMINDRHESGSSVMLVGHEPSMSSFISLLVSGTDDLSITMKKGGLCKLDVAALRYGRCATLEWLLAPRQLINLR